MGPAKTWSSAVTISILVAGCSGGRADDDSDVGQVAQAVSVCNENVPADRFIDGFPAYAQCPGFENSAIYSNNGIDTATSAQSSDWVRTQFNGGYQCTELAKRYWVFKWNVTWEPRGNAGFWCDETPPASSGVIQTQTPVHGDIMVLPPGSCGAGADTGHVAVVDTFDAASSRVTVVQQNRASRGQYNLSCGKCFLHVVKNGGGPPGSGGASGSGGATGSGGMPTGSGGVPTGSGGSLASGGVSTASGGVPAAGGGPGASGGVPASGGFPTGGVPAATGGLPVATGGLMGTGGVPATGGVYGEPSDSVDEESGCSVSPGTAPPHRGPLGLLLGGVAAGIAFARRRARR
jgi:hypothetical protein